MRAILALIVVLGTYLAFDASFTTLLTTTLAAFWLVALPGALVVALLLSRSLKSFETWVIGTALGITFLPLCFTLVGFFTTQASSVWWISAGLVSLLNLIAFALLRQPRHQQAALFPTGLSYA